MAAPARLPRGGEISSRQISVRDPPSLSSSSRVAHPSNPAVHDRSNHKHNQCARPWSGAVTSSSASAVTSSPLLPEGRAHNLICNSESPCHGFRPQTLSLRRANESPCTGTMHIHAHGRLASSLELFEYISACALVLPQRIRAWRSRDGSSWHLRTGAPRNGCSPCTGRHTGPIPWPRCEQHNARIPPGR